MVLLQLEERIMNKNQHNFISSQQSQKTGKDFQSVELASLPACPIPVNHGGGSLLNIPRFREKHSASYHY